MYFNRREQTEVGYWRKANAIHRWFVENVQDGNDDQKEYRVSEEQMKRLLDAVNKVLTASELVDGQIINGYQITDGKRTPILEKGKVIKDPRIAKLLLPTSEGFFFGGTAYDQYYYDDLIETKRIIEEALKTPGEYYYSSWW